MIEKIFTSIFLWKFKDKLIYIKEKNKNSKPYIFFILNNKTIFSCFPKKFFSKEEINYNYETNDFFVQVRGNKKASMIKSILEEITKKEPFNFYLSQDELLQTSLGVVFSITPKCNLKCKYCFNVYDYDLGKRNFLSDLSFEELKQLFDNFRQNGIQMIILSWWEPMLHPKLVDIVDYLYKRGFYIILNTNGTILNKNLIDRLMQYPIHWMISIHEREDSDAVKWVGIKNLLDVKLNFINYIKGKWVFFLEILTILTPENIKKLEKLYEFTYTYVKPDNWQFFRLFDVPGEKGSTKEDIILAIDKIYNLNKKYKVHNKIVDWIPYCVHPDIEKAANVIEWERHPSHMIKLTISPEWEVKYMCLFDEVLDNILKSKDIGNSLNHPLFKSLSNLQYLPARCKNCKYKRLCWGGSRFVAKLYTGKLNGEEPLMWASKIFI